MRPEDHPLARLSISDPDLAADITTLLDMTPAPVPQNDLVLLVNDTLWALSQEIAFGRAVGVGYAQNKEQGCRFLSLQSRLSLETCLTMQVAVPLSHIQHKLQRYVRTRIGRGIAIRSSHGFHVSGETHKTSTLNVFSDEEAIYLPNEIDVYDSKKKTLWWKPADVFCS